MGQHLNFRLYLSVSVHSINVLHQLVFPCKLVFTHCAVKKLVTIFHMHFHMLIENVFSGESFSTGLACLWWLWFLSFHHFHRSMQTHMPFEISMMWGFKLTHFTLIHFLLGAMLSHVVFKFDHTIPLFTTLSTFKRLFTVNVVVVHWQFNLINKTFSTIIAKKLSTLHLEWLFQLIKKS